MRASLVWDRSAWCVPLREKIVAEDAESSDCREGSERLARSATCKNKKEV